MLHKGKYVAVRFDPNSQIPNLAAKKYNNTIHKISRMKSFGAHGKLFELDGAVSEGGIHYSFQADDLEEVNLFG